MTVAAELDQIIQAASKLTRQRESEADSRLEAFGRTLAEIGQSLSDIVLLLEREPVDRSDERIAELVRAIKGLQLSVAAPSVTVEAARVEPAVVNVPAPVVNVPAPVVHVQAPAVTVSPVLHGPGPVGLSIQVKRDAQGFISSLEVTPKVRS